MGMKKARPPVASGYIPVLTLLAGFAALTTVILLAALPASCASLQETSQKTSKGTGSGTDPGIPQTIRPLGTRPAHLRTDPLNPVPNQQAITQALWAPGIDHGYVPQGLSFAEGQILMSAYRSRSPAVFMGPCRVYRMDPESGSVTGYFDLPPACGHAGGLAYAGNGVLILSDTSTLYRIDLEQALRERQADKAVTGTLGLAGALRGSFVTVVPVTVVPVTVVPVTVVPVTVVPVDEPGMFIGVWSASSSKARGYFLPLSLFDSHNGSTITEDMASSSIPLGPRAQGAAFDPEGSLWISYSSHDYGRVHRVDSASGQVLASHTMVSGTEDISFDERGGLWAVSEAGSLRWRSWRTSFPVVFRLDTALLE